MKSITLKVNGKEYELGFTRKSVIDVERKLNLSGLAEDDNNESNVARAFNFFYASFFAKYPKISEEEVAEIFAKTNNKAKLMEKIGEMYAETVKSLFPDEKSENGEEGNTNWEANW